MIRFATMAAMLAVATSARADTFTVCAPQGTQVMIITEAPAVAPTPKPVKKTRKAMAAPVATTQSNCRELEARINLLDVARPEEPAPPAAPAVAAPPVRSGRGRGRRGASAPATPPASAGEDFSPIQIRGRFGSPQ